MKEAKQFWVVWDPGHGAPVVQHDSVESAEREAERLARTNRGRTFHVLKLTASVLAPPADVLWARVPEEMPF